MFMTSIRNLLCAGLVAASAALAALVPTAAQEFSESHLAVAKVVTANTPLSKDFETVLPLLSQRVQNRLISLRPDLHEVISKTVQEVALRLAARRTDLDNAAALLWARAFTEEELSDIAAFYTSETGKKFVNLGPQLGQATIQTVQNWSNRVGEELLDKAREELKKQGHEL
jgi:hypothetical protein